jgi:hypothetical protein
MCRNTKTRMILNLNLSAKDDQTMGSDESREAVSLLSSDFHSQQTLLSNLNSVAVCRSQ